ncbi:MAG: hypothetical protein K0Q59_5390, partial [Paenibacillus sp.]|nr:hypothetical protein [Paenibacillus sp.]
MMEQQCTIFRSYQGGCAMIRSILTPRAIRRFALSIVVLFFMMVLFYRPTATGNDNNPKQVLLRLEDVGPGGQYANLEGLGKLRAVIDLLQEHQVSYQVAVVPRWINIAKDGTRYDESIDQSDRPYVRAFDGLLKAAAQNGAILGMHGYTHQVGDTYRSDGDHESGAGNEFNVQDVAETMTEAYAAKRAEAGADLFKKAGLFPYFWEAPHFRTLAKQDAVFRNYFGLHFQANMHTNRLAQQPFYMTGRNRGYGASSLGAVYVPTPLSYIPFNRDIDMVTKQLGKSSKLPALFFHPFLEFDYLTAVLDDEGNPQMAEGLPVYQYRDGGKSRLQKLIAYLSAHGYSFISITDLIPFIPAHSVPVGTEKQGKVQIADVTGDGQADVVSWDDSKGQVTVAEGQFRGLRNEAMPAARVWNELKLGKGDVWTLFDDNGDGFMGDADERHDGVISLQWIDLRERPDMEHPAAQRTAQPPGASQRRPRVGAHRRDEGWQQPGKLPAKRRAARSDCLPTVEPHICRELYDRRSGRGWAGFDHNPGGAFLRLD